MTEPLDLLARLRAWSYQRQQLARAAPEPAAALRAVVAVYSTHPTAPLALRARSAALDAASFGALEQRREVVRLPAMRQSIFLLPTEIAARVFAATRLPLEQHARRLAYAGLDGDEYARLKPLVLEAAGEPITPSGLQAALAMDARATMALRVMAREGLVLRLGSSLRTDHLRWVATAAWLGQPLEDADPAAALAWLGEAYLRAYGPARVADFAWWSGVPRRRAAAALAGVRVVDVGGGLLLPADEQAAFERIAPLDPAAVDVVPKWDSYTMGHAPDGRQRLVDDAHLPRAYSTTDTRVGATAGDGLPLVLQGGRAVASWSHRFAGQRLAVTVTPFADDALPPASYAGLFEEIGRLLDASAVEVVAGAAAS